MQRLFILAWSAVVIVVIALMVLLYVSLIPHFGIIGDAALIALIIVLGCGVSLTIAFTYNKIASWNLRRRLVTFADTGASFRERDGTWTHLSGIHQQMSLPPPTTVTVKEEPQAADDAIVELWQKGMSLRDIVRVTGRKYHEVQRITSEQKGG